MGNPLNDPFLKCPSQAIKAKNKYMVHNLNAYRVTYIRFMKIHPVFKEEL